MKKPLILSVAINLILLVLVGYWYIGERHYDTLRNADEQLIFAHDSASELVLGSYREAISRFLLASTDLFESNVFRPIDNASNANAGSDCQLTSLGRTVDSYLYRYLDAKLRYTREDEDRIRQQETHIAQPEEGPVHQWGTFDSILTMTENHSYHRADDMVAEHYHDQVSRFFEHLSRTYNQRHSGESVPGQRAIRP
jgi:hypothetical protein